MKLIDKSALVADIEKRLSLFENGTGDSEVMKRVEGVIKGYKSILSFLDTLEVTESPADAFIEKACEWIKEHKEEVETEDNGIIGWIPDYFIKDFKKYMEE